MTKVSGVVSAISVKELDREDKFGNKYSAAFKIGDSWFNFYSNIKTNIPNVKSDAGKWVSLSKGVEVSLSFTNKDGRNVVRAGDVTIVGNAPVASPEPIKESGGNIDFNTRAARGQALNLAVQIAIADKKHNDDSFILSQVGRFLALGEKVQSGDLEVASLEEDDVDDKDVDKLFE